jgi:colanic acid biosynthesis protein WcaH
MLDLNTFNTIVNSTPLVSIDLIIKNSNNEILIGKRINKPAKDYYFTIGGRVFKNETMMDASMRILKEELGLKINCSLNFIGIFEHFYEDSIFPNVSTHYINVAYQLNLDSTNLDALAKTQHSSYRWISVSDLMLKEDIHSNVKAYFKKEKNRAQIQTMTI